MSAGLLLGVLAQISVLRIPIPDEPWILQKPEEESFDLLQKKKTLLLSRTAGLDLLVEILLEHLKDPHGHGSFKE
ncbi:hypothetical protein GCM10022252_54710 [Streptosporangium oxazolinicum]|uniref:Uncharacterized protein n=1 Tax=Streptosporangium oxazolinicum TaxID=909287 RepID=A0ABP8B8K6_9ACTN